MGKLDKLLGQAKEHLEQSEQAISAVLGTYEAKVLGQDSVRTGMLIATDHRVVFYAKKVGGYELESFPYSNISSFEQGRNMMGPNITFFSSGNKVHIKWIKDGDVPEFVAAVRSRMGKSSNAAASAPDVAEQIRKLAELRDQGLLTDSEFQAKKTELLSRM
jgi:hypothetical protein